MKSVGGEGRGTGRLGKAEEGSPFPIPKREMTYITCVTKIMTFPFYSESAVINFDEISKYNNKIWPLAGLVVRLKILHLVHLINNNSQK